MPTASSGNAESTTAEGPPECHVGDHDCEAGFGCSQFDTLSPGYCGPIPEDGCLYDQHCREGFECHQGSHHSEIGECVPIDAESSGSSGSGSSTGDGSSSSTGG
jgi:hypothetical protein